MTNDEFPPIERVKAVSRNGADIYERIRGEYEPQYNGKFLAIEPESQEVYLGASKTDVVFTARTEHPYKIFYVVKVGSSVSEVLAETKVIDP